MFQVGLLVLTAPLKNLYFQLGTILKDVQKIVAHRLYIKLDPTLNENKPMINSAERNQLISLIPYIYYEASKSCENLDVRVLQSFAKVSNFNNLQYQHINQNFDVILSDSNPNSIKDKLTQQFNIMSPVFKYLESSGESMHGTESHMDKLKDDIPVIYNNTILGGTFDRLHNGHKLLLSEALLKTNMQLTIGVTDGLMLQKKLLWEMIDPIDKRISNLREFVNEVDPTVKCNIVPIYDPFGPAISVKELDCIIVSDETKKGGISVNDERKLKGLIPLTIHSINLVPDKIHCSQTNEIKLSSSCRRIQDLGKLLRPPIPKSHIPNTPYIIGLAGRIASGKSSIRDYLETLGAACIDCDELGHQCLEKDSRVFCKLIDTFGSEILDEEKKIDRLKLGQIIFQNEDQRQLLNKIMWPEIKNLAQEEIQKCKAKGTRVVVLEAALLFEAGWDSNCHQVWLAIIPRSEAIDRVMKRQGFNEESAVKRVNAQKLEMAAEAGKANVILCTLWEKSFTNEQIDKAWNMVQSYIEK